MAFQRTLDYNRELVALMNEIRYEWRTNPLIMGGSSGSEGGSTGAPGGVQGTLSQRNVSGDTSEGSFYVSSGSIGTLLDNLKNVRYWELPARSFGITPTYPETAHYIVSSGSWHYSSGAAPLIYTGGNTPNITAPSSGSRFDLLTISTAGVLTWVQGTEAANPSPPNPPSPTSGSMPLWMILSRSTGSVGKFYDDGLSHYVFRDYRPYLDWGIGGGGGSGVTGVYTPPNAAATGMIALIAGSGVSITQSSGSFTFSASGGSTYSVGAIPFANGSGILTDNVGQLYWDNSNLQLVVGRNGMGGTGISTPGAFVINNGTGATLNVISAGSARSPAFVGFASRGTVESPTSSGSSDIIMRVTGRGYGIGSYASGSRVRIDGLAVESWNNAFQGAMLQFWTTPVETTTSRIAASLSDVGVLSVPVLNQGHLLQGTLGTGEIVESNITAANTGQLTLDTDGTYTLNIRDNGTLNLAGFSLQASTDVTVPAQQYVVAETQTADIADTTLDALGASTLYQMSYYLLNTTADGGAGAITLHLTWDDGTSSRTYNSSALSLTANGYIQGETMVIVKSGVVHYSVDHTGSYGTADYALYLAGSKLIGL